MHLNEAEVDLFYNTWVSLLHYVNQRRKLVPSFPSAWDRKPVDTSSALLLRKALWEDDRLLTHFIRDNPGGLSPEALALVESWRHRVVGKFWVFRHLKKHTIFIGSVEPIRAYGVLGIIDSLKEVIDSAYLPLLVETTLMPFGKRIIYDGLLSSYRAYIGDDLQASLRFTYSAILERGEVLTSLPVSEGTPSSDVVQASNKKVLTAFQKALGVAGLSLNTIQEHTANLADLAEYLNGRTLARLLLDIRPADLADYVAARRGKVNFISLKRFAWFLRDTARKAPDEVGELLDFIKTQTGVSA